MNEVKNSRMNDILVGEMPRSPQHFLIGSYLMATGGYKFIQRVDNFPFKEIYKALWIAAKFYGKQYLRKRWAIFKHQVWHLVKGVPYHHD